MSFFSSNRTDNRCPGPITGNPLTGLCERVCIQTQRVFDSCMKQISITDLAITITDPVPANPTEPLTFVSATVNGRAYLTDLTIDRFPDRPNFARVTANVNIPILVTYTDANGVEGTGTSVITSRQDVILFVPQPSVVPFSIEVFGGAAIPDATYLGNLTFEIDACVTIILKVVVETNLLVPSYGYCPIPPCQDFTSSDSCPGFFDLPIYPTN